MSDATTEPEVDDSVASAVVGAYYPKLVSSVDAARSRAQSAYAIANALAGGLVGASLFTVFANAPTYVDALGFGAIAVWIVAAGLYVRAIASPLLQPTGDVSDKSVFVRDILKNASTERTTIDHRQRDANLASIAAVILTAASFALLLFGPVGTVKGTIDLTPAGVTQVSAVCLRPLSSLSGDIVRSSLTQSLVVIEVKTSACTLDVSEIRLPLTDIADIRS